jgi:hypothetical protein
MNEDPISKKEILTSLLSQVTLRPDAELLWISFCFYPAPGSTTGRQTIDVNLYYRVREEGPWFKTQYTFSWWGDGTREYRMVSLAVAWKINVGDDTLKTLVVWEDDDIVGLEKRLQKERTERESRERRELSSLA